MRRKLACFIAAFLLVALSPLCQADEKRLPFLVLFEPVEARFVRLTILGINEGNGVVIDELEVYAPKKTDNLAAAATGTKTTASSSLVDARHAVKFLNDGRYGNGSCWIAATNGIEWAQAELAQPHLIDTVAFSRDRTGKFADRIPGSFRVEVSLDGKAWQQVAHFPGPGGGARGKVTADRKQSDLIPAHQTSLPTKPLAAMPRVRLLRLNPRHLRRGPYCLYASTHITPIRQSALAGRHAVLGGAFSYKRQTCRHTQA